MKTKLRKILTLILTIVACFSNTYVAFAESAPKNLTIKSYAVSKTPVSFPVTFRAKTTNDGRYSYCAHYASTPPSDSITYARGSKITDAGINYILKEAYGANNDTEFFVYQTALWVYMVDKGIMPQPYYDLTVFKSILSKTNSEAAGEIRRLVKNAKTASGETAKDVSVKLATAGSYLTLDSKGEYYVSNAIDVSTNVDNYTVKFTSAPEGTKYTKSGKKLYIKVPANKVTNLNTTISFKVSVSDSNYVSYYYNPSNAKYQVMTATYKVTDTDTATMKLHIKKTASIAIVKVDSSTDKIISGAELQVLNSKGTVVDKWTSTTEAHTVTGLTEGTYVLKETKAPDGYKLSNVQTKFSVSADGTIKDNSGNKITKIEFENNKTGIVISKQDITSKEEVPGATLVIKNSDGKKVAEWVSTNKKHIIKGLKAGTYTLTETIAPNGYVLSKETITFKIDASGNVYDKNGNAVSQIIMYNEKEKAPEPTPGGVSVSKQDITNGKEVEGATLVIKDASGNVIDTWVSTTTPHVIEELKAGTYTLTETIAPNGYVLSNETITFTVKDDGTITKVVMYNEPKKVEVPVENTASFKTVTSSVIGVLVMMLGTFFIVKTSKKNSTLN